MWQESSDAPMVGYGPCVPAAGSPRIRPGTRREIGWINTGIVKVAGFMVGGEPPRVFTTMARHRVLFRRWMGFAGKLMPGGKLPRVEAELVILRVAHRTGSEYEWAQHEQLAELAGLTKEEIARVKLGSEAPGWSERQALMLAAVDELLGDNRIGDELWARLVPHFDEIELIELCVLTGHYAMLAMTLNSLAVVPDPISDPPRRLRWMSKR
jgi:AhpD family alkylhydroperoxidase